MTLTSAQTLVSKTLTTTKTWRTGVRWISAHSDCFHRRHSCLRPNSLVDAIERCFKLQRLNLSENGREYPWGRVKRQVEFFQMFVEDGQQLPECVVVWPEGMADTCHHYHHSSYGNDSEDC